MTTKGPEAAEAPAETAEQSSTRGGFLRALGIAAGAAMVGQMAGAETADANDGQQVLLGSAHTAEHQTSISMTPNGTPDASARSAIMGRVNAVDHYGVTGQGVGATTNGGTGNAVGVWGDARTGLANLPVFAPQNRWGVLGTSDVVAVVGVSEASTGNDGGIGVNGYSNHPNNGVGVWGQADGPNGTGVFAEATVGSGGVGLVANGTENGAWFGGGHAAVWLVPRTVAGPATDASVKGEVLVDSDGVMWLCTADGTPGTWIRISHGGARYLASPQRAYDSRTSGAGKLRPGAGDTNAPRVIPIAGVVPGVPQNAVGVFGNLTVTGGSQGSFASIWPGGAWPGTSSINFQANTDLANAFSVGLGANGMVSVATFAPTQVDVIVDVAGYVL
jgi:hypothetical protein